MKSISRWLLYTIVAFLLMSGDLVYSMNSGGILPLPISENSPTVQSQDMDVAYGYEIPQANRINFEEAPEADYAGDQETGEMSYTVRKGDTLGSISKNFFGTTRFWKKISGYNGIKDPSGLKIGRVLKIPGNLGKRQTNRQRAEYRQQYPTEVIYAPVDELPSVQEVQSYSADAMVLPPVTQGSDVVLFQDKGLPQIILPELGKKEDTSRNNVSLEGLTGLIRTFAAYPLGDGVFSTSFSMVWNKITMREGNRLKVGEDGDYYQFPIALTYGAENFEVAVCLPFESYDIYAPITYNFRDGSDSGMGDASLRLKFSSQNDNMASCLGIGAIFPTNDRVIGIYENDNSWEVFGGVSTKRKEGGNLHVNLGYQASNGNTAHEGVFGNVGFDYKANESFNFMGEINAYNRVNNGRSTDLTLGMRYFVKEGMTFSLAAPIALNNDMFFGYDYRLLGQLQYHY